MVAERDVANGGVEIALRALRQVHRRAALGRQRRDRVAVSRDHPETGAQADRHRLQHAGEVEREDADAHAELGQRLAVLFAEFGELLLDRLARDHAQPLAELEHDAARARRDLLGRSARVHQFGKAQANARLHPGGHPLAHFFTGRAVEQIGGQRLDLRGQHIAAWQQARDRSTAPADPKLRVENELAIGCRREGGQARRQVLAQRAQRRTQHRLLVGLLFRLVGNEPEALDASEMLALDNDFAGFGD